MNKVAIVTGGSAGIGRAVGLALAEADWKVIIAGRNQQNLAAVCKESNGKITAITTDVCHEESVAALFTQTLTLFGRIDLLFNNAGTGATGKPIAELSIDEWTSVMNTNVTGSFLCAREAFKHMPKQTPKGGRIINNGSISAHVPRPHFVPYTVSKHAMTGLTRSLSLEGREHDIACGQIDIGNAATDMTQDFAIGSPQADGSIMAEPTMDISNVVSSVLHMANLPLNANVQFMTVLATKMPYIGRG